MIVFLKSIHLNAVSLYFSRRAPMEVIVFIVGGATYEEALTVHQMNNSGYNCILGGTTIHNSESFLVEVKAATDGIILQHTRNMQRFQKTDGV